MSMTGLPLPSEDVLGDVTALLEPYSTRPVSISALRNEKRRRRRERTISSSDGTGGGADQCGSR